MERIRACKVCGSLFRPIRDSHKCCSRNCAANAYYHKRLTEEKPVPEELSCPHNDALICNSRDCDSCGWNPRVAKGRLKRYLQKHGGTV